MKRNSLTTALLAGLAGAAGLATTAQAVNLNPDGLGQVLIYPYYTVNKGNQSLVSVVNTTNRVKAVKVRFLESLNSKEVLDFNLYLSPFDVWTGTVVQPGATTEPGVLVTSDTSCTVPRITGPVPFRNYQYTASNIDHPSSIASTHSALSRTREGHLEMIEMGLLQTGAGALQLAEEATHGTNGIPANCNALVNAWTPGAFANNWVVNGAQNIDLPAGGLFGAMAMVNVANGTMHSYDADAVEGFYTNAAAPGALHARPGTTLPSLRQYDNGGTATAFVFSQNGASVITETFPINPVTPDAVSLVFMHDAIYNEFNTETGLSAASEWIITFPTKRFYVDSTTTAIPPFTNPFRDNGSACDIITISYFDREERQPGTPPGVVDFSPPPPDPVVLLPALCYEANNLTFNQSQVAGGTGSSTIFGSTLTAFNLNTTQLNGPAFQNGWVKVAFDNPVDAVQNNVLTAPDQSQYFGLPATGFWSVNFVNASAAPGTLANYSGAFHHRGSRANSG
jgi:hypothetical protein